MTATPDSWTERFLLGITKEGSTEQQFAGITSEITGLDFGEKDIESTPLASGGRVVRPIPMTIESVTLKLYPVTALLDGTGIVQQFHPQVTDDSSVPVVVENTITRKKHKIVFVWSTTLPATASTLPTLGSPSYRVQIINAYMTRYKPSFDNREFTAEATFKWAPFNKAGTVGNKREEYTSGSAQLAAATTSVTAWA